MTEELRIRPAAPADVPVLRGFIRALAEYERLAGAVTGTEEDLRAALFGEQPCAEALIAEWRGEPAGFALYFTSFSTFLARPGLWLEDLFVLPRWRGRGIGGALLASLARLAVERGCGRLEWMVLDWNEPALRFYRRLGARPLEEWTVERLAGDALARLAARARAAAAGAPGGGRA